MYREDADVAWRAQLMGWQCLYVPYARGYHVRKVLPGNRRALPPEINMHSVKNRFLMRIKNISPDLYRRNWSPLRRAIWWWSVLPAAGAHFAEGILASGEEPEAGAGEAPRNQARRRVDRQYIASWFQYEPVSQSGARKKMRPRALALRDRQRR